MRGREELNPVAQKAYLDTLCETLKTTKPLHATKVDDVVRKSEVHHVISDI